MALLAPLPHAHAASVLASLDKYDATLRLRAARQLRYAGKDAARQAMALASQMACHKQLRWHREAAAALEQMGEEGATALATCLGDEDELVGLCATEALISMGEIGAIALDERLGNDCLHVQESATTALGYMGHIGASKLVCRLQDKNEVVRILAAKRLAELDLSPPHAAALADTLEDNDDSVRKAVADGLKTMGTVGANALKVKFRSTEAVVQQLATEVLQNMGAAGAHALGELLCDVTASVRRRASVALQAMSAIGAKELASLLQADDAGIRWRAAEALGKMDEMAMPFVQQLSECLKDENSWVQVNAARALEKLGKCTTSPLAKAGALRYTDILEGATMSRPLLPHIYATPRSKQT